MNRWLKNNPGFIVWLAFLLFMGITVFNIFYDIHFQRFDFFTWFFKVESLLFFFILSYIFQRLVMMNQYLHQEELKRLDIEQKWQLKEKEISTLHEVTRSLQHNIANPLAIILMVSQAAKRHGTGNLPDEDLKRWEQCEIAAKKISEVLVRIQSMTEYETEETPAGKVIRLEEEKEQQ
ncbi:MAG: hypothetical protein ABSB78_05360 [Bacteroidota bacterium]